MTPVDQTTPTQYCQYTCDAARINQKTNQNYTLIAAMCHKISPLDTSIAVDADAAAAQEFFIYCSGGLNNRTHGNERRLEALKLCKYANFNAI